MGKLAKEIVNERIVERGIALVGEYLNARTKATFQCADRHQWKAVPYSVMRGGGCPHCTDRVPLTKEAVNERIAERGVVMIGEYLNSGTKTTFECAEGHQWQAWPTHVMRGCGCPHCAGVFPLTKEIVNERIAERGIALVGEYLNARTKATFQCAEGHEWDATPNSVMQGGGCPECASYGYNQCAAGRLYIIGLTDDLTGKEYVKVGITNGTIDQRFERLPKTTRITSVFMDDWHQNGANVMGRETTLKRELEPYLTADRGFMGYAGGYSEIYEPEVVGLMQSAAVTSPPPAWPIAPLEPAVRLETSSCCKRDREPI